VPGTIRDSNRICMAIHWEIDDAASVFVLLRSAHLTACEAEGRGFESRRVAKIHANNYFHRERFSFAAICC
jgi:hypothetical protein